MCQLPRALEVRERVLDLATLAIGGLILLRWLAVGILRNHSDEGLVDEEPVEDCVEDPSSDSYF
jgi:hypothetical protein